MSSEKRGKSTFFDTSRYVVPEQTHKAPAKPAVNAAVSAPVSPETSAPTPAESVPSVMMQKPETVYTPKVEFGSTQGKKGHKLPRINMAFSPDNHSWIKMRSRQLGISATEFVNRILDQERLK